MKRSAIWFLVSVFSIQLFSTVLMNGAFHFNRDWIEKTFCINKSKPELECHGSCHLKKEIEKKAENEENSQAGIQLFSFTGVINNQRIFFCRPHTRLCYPFISATVHSAYHGNTDHPPRA